MTEQKRKTLQEDPEYLEVIEAMKTGDEIEVINRIWAGHRTSAFDAAMEGDYGELSKLVLDRLPLNDTEAQLAADLILQKIPPKQGRPKKPKLSRKIGLR